MTPDRQEEKAGWLVEDWTGRLAQIVETMSGERPVFRVTPGGEDVPPSQPPPPDSDALLWWEQRLSPEAGAAVWVGAPQPTWQALGGLALRSAGLAEAEQGDARNSYLEILSQSLSGLAQSLGADLGATVGPEPGQEVVTPSEACKLFEVRVALGGAEVPSLFMAVGTVLLEKLGGAGDQKAAGGSSQSQSAKTLDLLMEVELPVSVSFGRAQLPLKDVLKLTTGSIVELNRTVEDPVELIINNCVIARGEVVMVEGNYGVRIQEILSRQERLRTLK
jgi:flagellar motor switch protein FliN/FliY